MMRISAKKRNKKGFTLIELVVVIAILGILAAIAIPRLGGTQIRATQKVHDYNLRTLDGSISIFEAEYGELPTEITQLTTPGEYTIKSKSIVVTDALLTEAPDIPSRLGDDDMKDSAVVDGNYYIESGKAWPVGTWTDAYRGTETNPTRP